MRLMLFYKFISITNNIKKWFLAIIIVNCIRIMTQYRHSYYVIVHLYLELQHDAETVEIIYEILK